MLQTPFFNNTMISSYSFLNKCANLFRYYMRQCAQSAIRYISGTKLDERIIRTDWDIGFIEGRQYGRGKTGGQVRLHLSRHKR